MNELQEIFAIVNALPPIEIEYRLYHDANGNPLFKSGDRAPGDNYIVITKDQFDRVPTHYMLVQDGKLVINDPAVKTSGQALHRVTMGIPVVQGHPALIIEDTDTNFQVEYYGTNN